MLLEITSVITAATLVVMAVCLIPVLMELRKTAISLRNVAESMQVELTPLIKELRETVTDIQMLTSATAANVDGMNMFMSELGHAGHNIRTINKVIGVASTVAGNSAAWMTGVRVAGKFLADKLIKKGGDCHVKG